MVLFALAETTLFGAAAAFSTLIGVALAILGHRENRKDAEHKAELEAHEQLLAARREAEELSAELHKLRMKDLGGLHAGDMEVKDEDA